MRYPRWKRHPFIAFFSQGKIQWTAGLASKELDNHTNSIEKCCNKFSLK